jgi:hypothetical protein
MYFCHDYFEKRLTAICNFNMQAKSQRHAVAVCRPQELELQL